MLRSGPLDDDLLVQLSSGDRSEATVPATIVIPAGFDARTFPITPVDDALVDGPQFAPIIASAPGYGSATFRAQVKDDEVSLTVSVQDSVIDENAGVAATVGRVTLSAPVPIRVGIRVYSTLPGLLVNGVVTGYRQFAYVDLLPGQSSGTFRIDAIDNAQIQGNQSAIISADVSFPFGGDYSRSQFIQGNFVPVTIRDDESSVRLRISPRTLIEGQSSSAQVFLGVQSNRTQPNTVTLESSRPEIVRVPTAVSVVPGRQGNTFFIKVAPDGIDGAPQSVTITARREGYTPATVTLQIVDANAPRLSLKIAPRVVEEGGIGDSGQSEAGGLVSIAAPPAAPLEVRLSVSDKNEARVPQSVVIPAGSTLARFPIAALDDRLLDGTRDISIFAEADNFAPARAPLTIRSSTPFVTAYLSTAQLSESAGAVAARVIVKLNRPARDYVNVFLAVSDNRLIVPLSVSFAPGQTLLSIPVTVVDDEIINESHRARISVQQPFPSTAFRGTPPIELPLQIFDNDAPLSLEISNTRLSERAPRTARATVTRTGSVSEPLVVTLRARVVNDLVQPQPLLRVPRSVTIAAGARSASFEISVADNDQALYGTQVNLLTASAAVDGRSTDTTLDIEIEDDDRTLLGVLFDSDTIGESGITRAFATLLLPGPAKADYTFYLINTHPSRLQVPQAVVIPKGRNSVTFPVDAINNTRDDEDVHVQITPRKPGFRGLESAIRVLDDDGGTE